MLKALITLEARVMHPLLPIAARARCAEKHTEVEALAGAYPASDGVAQRLERLTVNQRSMVQIHPPSPMPV